MKKSIPILLCLTASAKLFGGPFFSQASTNEKKSTSNGTAESWRTEDRCCVAKSNFYINAFGGANFLENSSINGNKATYRVGYVFSGSLGYCWRYGVRPEFEYAFRRNAISRIDFVTQGYSTHGHFQTSSYMANLLWDLPLCTWGCTFANIQPFIGAGIGFDHENMHASNSRVVFRQDWNRFSWQAMGGFSYLIFRHTELTLEYKFHQGGNNFYNHAVGLGLTYKFGYLKKC